MDVKQVTSAIMFGDFTNDELSAIISAVTFARSQLARKNKFMFTVGKDVQFRNKSGQYIKGTVAKVNRKFVLVSAGFTTWRVPASMLETA